MKTKRLLTLLFACMPLIIAVIVLPILPDSIPAHFGFSGEVDRYGSKYEMLITPLFALFFQVFWILYEKSVMKDKEKGEHNAKALFWDNIIVTFILLAVTIWFLRLSYVRADSITDGGLSFATIFAVALSIGWIMLGNILPKCKQNTAVGIRTKWTLESEVVWYKTHRFGGRTIMIFGVVSTVLCLTIFSGLTGIFISVGGLLVLCVVSIVYSYVVSKQQPHHS